MLLNFQPYIIERKAFFEVEHFVTLLSPSSVVVSASDPHIFLSEPVDVAVPPKAMFLSVNFMFPKYL